MLIFYDNIKNNNTSDTTISKKKEKKPFRKFCGKYDFVTTTISYLYIKLNFCYKSKYF